MATTTATRDLLNLPLERVKLVTCKPCGARVDVSRAKPFSVIPCPRCQTHVRVPALFGPFHLTRLLGAGAMAQVFEGVDRALDRRVAIKIIHSTLGGAKANLQGCIEEARALASLNHPNVVQVHTIGQKGDLPFIVMELVDGGRLDSLIAGVKALDEVMALKIGIDIAHGLKAAYSKGLIHGDVKPANILLDRRGPAKLVDFGIARYVNTQTGERVYGTPQYVAPEVALKMPVDHRADIFSLGATLFHALSGEFPFRGPTTNQMILARAEKPPPDLRQLRPSIHRKTAATVARMLQPNPEKRYPNYDALIRDLESSLESTQQQFTSVELASQIPLQSNPDLAALDQAIHQFHAPSGEIPSGSSHRRSPLSRRRRRSKARIVRRVVTFLLVLAGLSALVVILRWGVARGIQ